MDATQRLRRDRARKKLRKLISRSDKLGLLAAMWVLDRAWSDPMFRSPPGYDFPRELFGGDFPTQYSVYAWEVETLVTEILRTTPNPGPRVGKAQSWGLVSSLVNNLRTIEDAEYALGPDSPIEREMSRIAHRQFRWQSNNWEGAEYVRWWSILSDPNLAQVIQRSVGTSLNKFISIGVAWNNIFNQRKTTTALRNTDVIWITDQDVAATIAAVSVPIANLIVDSHASALESQSMAYRRGVLRQKPVISFQIKGVTHYTRPIEMLLKWRLSSGLYYDVISDRAVRDNNWIGAGFEKYIRDLWQAKYPTKTITGDLPYGTKAQPRRTPDVLVAENGALTHVIECKVAKMPLVVQASVENSPARTRVIDDVATGVKQVCAFLEVMNEGLPVLKLANSESVLLIVVTLDDWVFFGNDMRKEIFELARKKLEAENLGNAVSLVEEVILCTAEELELLLTVQEPKAVDDVLRRSLLHEHKGSSLGAVMATVKTGRLENPRNPLGNRLQQFIGAKS